MSAYLKRLLILAVVILGVAGVDGAIRGLRMPPQAGTELPAWTQQALAEARARQQISSTSPTDAAPNPALAAQTQDVPAEDPSDGKGMTTADLYAAWEAGIIHLVDARLPHQYREGHIPRAHSIPFESITSGYPAALDLLPFEGPIVVYCEGGDCNASRNVASMLIDMGFENVSVFERGLDSWARAGYPIETGGETP